MKQLREIAFGIVLLAALVGGAPAATILSLSGDGGSSGLVFEDQARSVRFDLATPVTAASLFAETTCWGCSVTAYLTTRIGSSYDPDVDTVAFDGLPSSGAIFQGLTLGAGTYYLTLVNRAGLLSWTASTVPTITSENGSTAGFNFRANKLSVPVINSTFEIIDRTDRFHFLVEGSLPASDVPEPSTLAGGAFALFLLAGSRLLAVAKKQR